MKKLILGCGYLGRRVAQAWLDRGQEVLALTRSAERAKGLESSGIRPIVGDVTNSLDLSECGEIDTVLFAVGYDRTAGKVIRDVYVEGLRRTLEQLPNVPRRFIYISSTGVFAQNERQWVDERSSCNPVREGGRACLDAERLLQQHSIGQRAIILRLAGIYGPDRLPKLRDVIDGKPIKVRADGYLNLIHVDDAVQIVLAAEEQLSPPELLLVSDGHPVSRGDFYRELARVTDSPEPRFDDIPVATSVAVRASSDKRIDSALLRERLDFTYCYPSYVEGLAAVAKSFG